MRFFLAVIICFITTVSIAEIPGNTDYIVRNFSVNQGLAHKTVICMMQDKDGFVWIGTTNGLSRFDGYSFKNYFHSNTDSTSMNGIGVWAIAEGLDGKIWISTNEGLEYFDKEKEVFGLVQIPNSNQVNFSKNISVDKQGYVWVYSPLTDFIAINPKDNSIAVSGLSIPKVFFDNKDIVIYAFTVIDDVIWVASSGGVFKYFYKSGDIEFIHKASLNHCFSLHVVDETTLLFTFLFDGIYKVNTKTSTGTWMSKKLIINEPENESAFYVSTYTKDSTYWIGTTKGVVVVDKQLSEMRFRFLEHDIISYILRDKENNILLGTYNKGFFLIKENNKQFRTIMQDRSEKPEQAVVNNLQVFSNGSVLYTNNAGFYYISNFLQPKKIEKISNASMSSIYHLNSTRCFANNVDTLFEFDTYTKKMSKKIVSSATNCAYLASNKILWLGTWHGLIYGYDENNKRKYSISIDKNTGSSIYQILGDDDGSLWVATYGSGLVHIEHPTSTHPIITKYMYIRGKNSISSNIVHSIYRNSGDSLLWIGTCGGGLNVFNTKTKKFIVYTIAEGLKTNVVESLISDNEGNIWIGTNVLTKFDVQKKTFTHFTESDGINGVFIINAVAKAPNGYLLFGTSKGVLVVNPKSLLQDKKYNKPYITDFKIRGVSVQVGQTLDDKKPYTSSITYSKSIEIPYEFNSFSFEFASIHIGESNNIVYEYMLQGLDKTWIPAEKSIRIASYSALQPGTYVFKVRAGNGNGLWSDVREVTIEIVPPFWKTWWFRILVFMSLCAIGFSIIYYRFRIIKQQSSVLDAKVKERTKELLVANKNLYSRNEQLKQNQIVIEMRNADLNEALQAKDELIKILGHDFKNPLTGILGLADLLKTEKIQTNQKKVKKFAELIHASASSLLSQMLTVVEWAQSLNTNLTAHPIDINIETLVDDAISLVKESAMQKQIYISKQVDFEYNAFVDPRMIGTVFRNILTNAIKFSHVGGSVLIIIQELDTTIDIVFIDTGIGMNEQYAQQVFVGDTSISRLGTSNERGSGIGLHVCKTFVEKNCGSISVMSEEHKGAIFTVSLPKAETLVIKTQLISADNSIENTDVERKESNTILIIDDSIEIREMIEGLFDANNTVIKAEDGKEGLYIAQHVVPDIILCDIILPSIHGYEICQTLKTDDVTKHIPIILISSQIGLDIETKSFESGANDFIQKPFNSYVLQQKVLALLELKKQMFDKMSVEHEMDKKLQLPLDYDNKIILKVLEFIEQNLNDTELDTETVSTAIGVSRTQLWRIFKKTTGKTLGDYIRDLRLEKAAEMLKTGKYRISEVAFEVGYSDAKYFTKNFQKKYGVSPTQFAADHQK